MNTIPTLKSVQAAFAQRRQHKPHLRSPFHGELRDQALPLQAHCAPGVICKALGISRGMLQSWQGHSALPPSTTAEPLEFVLLPTEPPRAETERLQLALTRANGDRWCLQGDPSAEQLRAFVTALSGAAR